MWDWSAIARSAEENCIQVLARVRRLPPDISLEGFIRAATDVGPLDNYKYVGDATRGMIERIKTTCGLPAARAFLRAALGRTISIRVKDGQYARLPPLCARYHFAQLHRIANDSDATAEWLDLDDDRFQKEFGIASLRLYVAGSNLVDCRCGIPRSIIFHGGLGKVLARLGVMMRLGGFKPYFQGHLHTFNLDALNEEGRNNFYRCCVELYPLHPDCLGMFCSSWYYDPALAEISPNLAYLREIPLAGGAHLFRAQDGGDAIANSTAKSRTRRELYERGEYLPRNYFLIWGREDQTEWVRTHPRATT